MLLNQVKQAFRPRPLATLVTKFSLEFNEIFQIVVSLVCLNYLFCLVFFQCLRLRLLGASAREKP
jgi:hypothetical protein